MLHGELGAQAPDLQICVDIAHSKLGLTILGEDSDGLQQAPEGPHEDEIVSGVIDATLRALRILCPASLPDEPEHALDDDVASEEEGASAWADDWERGVALYLWGASSKGAGRPLHHTEGPRPPAVHGPPHLTHVAALPVVSLGATPTSSDTQSMTD